MRSEVSVSLVLFYHMQNFLLGFNITNPGLLKRFSYTALLSFIHRFEYTALPVDLVHFVEPVLLGNTALLPARAASA